MHAEEHDERPRQRQHSTEHKGAAAAAQRQLQRSGSSSTAAEQAAGAEGGLRQQWELLLTTVRSKQQRQPPALLCSRCLCRSSTGANSSSHSSTSSNTSSSKNSSNYSSHLCTSCLNGLRDRCAKKMVAGFLFAPSVQLASRSLALFAAASRLILLLLPCAVLGAASCNSPGSCSSFCMVYMCSVLGVSAAVAAHFVSFRANAL